MCIILSIKVLVFYWCEVFCVFYIHIAILDCPRAYSANDQGTEGKRTDVVCYCIEFQLLVLCLCKNALSCSAERVVLL